MAFNENNDCLGFENLQDFIKAYGEKIYYYKPARPAGNEVFPGWANPMTTTGNQAKLSEGGQGHGPFQALY